VLSRTQNADDADEGDFLAALQQRDPHACETLVRTYGGQMSAIAQRYLRCEQDCADAVQEAFISAFHAMDKFEGNSRLGTWLHRIVVNACLMKIRSRGRRPETTLDDLQPTFDRSGHHSTSIGKWRDAPDEQLRRDETRAVVRRCIDMLPDDYRTVLVLRDIEEFSTEQSAAMLGATPGAIKTRLHRARQALRTLLEPHFES
jgi:RNA polymerase sigma-70 factor (ECF subfamily)